MFVIEDERHAETVATFSRRDEAMAELQRLAVLPWDQRPNLAPCIDWADCGRSYELIEYDTSTQPWRELSRHRLLDVSSTESRWHRHRGAEQALRPE
jgi:hypothetical protein